MVQEVNAVAARIAELNGTIRSATASGMSANDLMDQRDKLVMQLAGQVGATVRSDDDGSLNVYVGAMALVRSSSVEQLAVVVGPGPAFAARVAWADDGLTATVGGEAQGLLETNNVIVPGQRADLAAVAQKLHDDVNAIHATGFDQNGAAGVPFFQMGANGIEVNPAVAADPRLVAASGTAGAVDGSVAQQLAAQQGPDGLYRQMIVRLGVSSQTVTRRVDVQDAIVRQLDAARDSEAGVNLDEEMTDLVAFQNAYSAAARFVTVVDDLLDTLIGMV
jgi:flagellar hook-associated protein 1 FlgK